MEARMEMFTRIVGVGALAVFLALPVRADDFFCDGTFTDAFDNVIVPDDAVCILELSEVLGNILVEAGGALSLVGSSVGGNVQADGASYVELLPFSNGDVTVPTVAGNVQLKNGTWYITIDGAEVIGDVQLEDNHLTGSISVEGSTVGGNLQLYKNSADGSIDISGNGIAGNFQCIENDPAPAGGDNTVGGNAEDQCEDLVTALAVPGDCDGDGLVGILDLLAVLMSWGPCAGCAADFDNDNFVGTTDFLLLLGNWG